MSCREKSALIEKGNSSINLSRQAELLDMSRSSLYYEPVINQREIEIKHSIDKIYTACPFYGSRKIKEELEKKYQIRICRDYARRLMNDMGLSVIYPKRKPSLSQGSKFHQKYPYLLRDLKIEKPNQVWGTDITYIRLRSGFAYLTAILDWFSRYVISWQLSPTLESKFCIRALEEALEISVPEIHNSDQGKQFTAESYTAVLKGKEIRISMDGRGRCMDNIFTERLWRTVKYENVYIRGYSDYNEAREGLNEYLQFYNHERIHQSLGYKTPAEIYFQRAN